MLIVDKEFSNKLISILFENDYNLFVKAFIRSLTSNSLDLSVVIDESRWKDELILMKYYYDIKNNRSLAACLAPIIITNREIEKMSQGLEESYNIMYGSDNASIKAISIFVILVYVLNLDIKANLISFEKKINNQTEIIDFQREKIKFLMMKDYDIVNYALNQLYIDNKAIFTKELTLINYYKNIIKEKFSHISSYKSEFGENINILSDYLLDLRLMKIKRKPYEKKINPLDLINMEVNKNYNLPLIGNILIVDKYLHEDILCIEAHSKSELYKFRLKKVK